MQQIFEKGKFVLDAAILDERCCKMRALPKQLGVDLADVFYCKSCKCSLAE